MTGMSDNGVGYTPPPHSQRGPWPQRSIFAVYICIQRGGGGGKLSNGGCVAGEGGGNEGGVGA